MRGLTWGDIMVEPPLVPHLSLTLLFFTQNPKRERQGPKASYHKRIIQKIIKKNTMVR
jgi:hypothetical protein